MNKKIRSKSIAFKLAVAFIFSAVFQSVLLSALMMAGGVLQQSKENQYQIFSEKVTGRRNSLENEMKNSWTHFDKEADSLRSYFETLLQGDNGDYADRILEEVAPTVLNALQDTNTTGAFLILPNRNMASGEALQALYFKNNSPEGAAQKDSNLYMLVGPWNVAEKMEIATTANWSFRLSLNQDNRDFVYKPYEAALGGGSSEWLGYWSPPFCVNPGDDSVITYSVPLILSDGTVAAIFGVEVSVSYLYHFLPASDLQASNSYGYVIGVRNGEGAIETAVTYGALQKKVIEANAPLDLEVVDENNSICRVLNHSGGNELYGCVSQLGLYYHNTPFEKEQWFLIGLMEKPVLLYFPNKIGRIVISAFLISMVIGFVLAILISQWFTKHAKLIELSELPIGAFEMRSHSSRVLMTSQVPRLLGLTKAQERSFCKDKRKFAEFLQGLSERTAEDENVFLMEYEGQPRWIRLSRKDGSGSIRCILEDVTDEVLQTRALRVERDRDGLTGVGNRFAYEKMIEQYSHELKNGVRPTFVMCDLNDLKSVNDIYGHNKGDEYIKSAAKMLQNAFPKGEIFRIGGDEFVVMIKEEEPDLVQEGIVGLAGAMEAYSASCGFPASIAAGWAVYDPDLDTRLESTLSRADAYMYGKKRQMKR